MKYPSTAIVLPTANCFSHCRFCFRKRLFTGNIRQTDILDGMEKLDMFLRQHTSINNILITGGDPLILTTHYLKKILSLVLNHDHIEVIRFGSRVLTYFPSRIETDPALIDVLKMIRNKGRRAYLVCHFNHPRELTPRIQGVIDQLMGIGIILQNQTVLLRGINDSPDVLKLLFTKLTLWGIIPYYVFQCKFVISNKHFRIPLHETCKIFLEATRGLNGLAKRPQLIMAHFSGKIEILGTNFIDGKRYIYLKYHQARDESVIGNVLSFSLPDNAYWFDDLYA